MGTIAMSSRLVDDDEPALVITPITVNGTLFTVTVWSIGDPTPNNSEAVVEPSTATSSAPDTCCLVKNPPSCIWRSRTAAHDAVLPTTVVVQLLEPAVNSSIVSAWGATAITFGATRFDPSALASARVSVLADPKPARIPLELVVLPG